MPEVKKMHLLAAIRSGRRFDGERFAKSCGTMRSQDEWLLPFQAPYQHASFDASDTLQQLGGISVARFEKKANAARRRAALNQASPDPDWPTLKSSVLIDALAEATRELSDPDAAAHTPLVDFNIMSGLQIYGVEIVPDVAFRNGSLNLVNVSFPFSVRLICCVLRVPVALSNVQLVTLDLSGSALLGLDAKFLHARGSVRMRRSFSLGPVDFAGAEIHGYFDACDLLILPFGQTPADQAVDGDSGMLSLNQASIDNEVRLNRAEIWGGLSMRGLRTKRSIHINESRIFSPLATLERLFLDQIAPMEDWKEIKPGGAKSTGYEGGLRWHRFINRVAYLKYAPGHEAISTRAINLFLCENLRVRTSAVRADAMTVDGSIFAKDMKCRGRFRMKYARISGGLSMQGSRFSSAELQRRSFDSRADQALPDNARRLFEYRQKTYDALVSSEDRTADALANGSDDYAIDLSECEVRGSLRLGLYKRDMQRQTQRETHIDGVVAIERARIGGELIFGRTQFEWTRRTLLTEDNRSKTFEKREEDAQKDRKAKAIRGDIFAIRGQGIVTGDDVSFLDSTGLIGADFGNAQIGGNLAFFEELKPADDNDLLKVTHASNEVTGRIRLESATIAGDCKLIFDPEHGPTIRAEKAVIARSLQFSSRPIQDSSDGETKSTIWFSPLKYREAAEASFRVWLDACDAAARDDKAWREWNRLQRERPSIDLGNARATLLQHPPSAWPEAGCLQINGFRYERALAFGPLGPHPFSREPMSINGLRRRSKAVTWGLLAGGMALSWLSLLDGQFGSFDLGRTETMLMAVLMLAAWAVRLLSLTSPNADHTEPMAIEYLKRQIISRNAYRTPSSIIRYFSYVLYVLQNYLLKEKIILNRFNESRLRGHVYNSLEPYQIAAAALREEGRWTSANIVEQRRQQERISHLSWRNNPFHKMLFHVIRVINQFGFSISRPIFLILLAITCGAMVAHQAKVDGAIQPKFFKVEAQVPDLPVVIAVPDQATMADRRLLRVATSMVGFARHLVSIAHPNWQTKPSSDSGFEPLLFALDKVVPVLDLGQDQDWDVDKRMSPFPAGSGLAGLSYTLIFAIFKIVGLTIVTLLFIALSTRVGSVFGRYKE